MGLWVAFCLLPLAAGCPHCGETSLWPTAANTYSWDGSWKPVDAALPPEGLFDSVYSDGHLIGGVASPILPPGRWDWDCAGNACLLGAYRSFMKKIGTFEPLVDAQARNFGWRLVVTGTLDAGVDIFYGSPGTEVVDCGVDGGIASTGGFQLGDGPDMIRYGTCSASSWRTGSSETGHAHDDDLVIAGADEPSPAGEFDVRTSTVHTGPGRDLVFMNNIQRAAVDLGNGADGRTDSLDPDDGGDLLVLGGNYYDVRVFGGNGDDVFIWRVDEISPTATNSVPGNFFGGGGWDPGVWDEGVDRLVLDIPAQTPLSHKQPDADIEPGTVTLDLFDQYPEQPVADTAQQDNVYTRYYVHAGVGPQGQKTLTLRYRAPDDHVRVLVMLTAIEELQIGIGDDAKVYEIDQTTGETTLSDTRAPIAEVPSRAKYVSLIESFGRS